MVATRVARECLKLWETELAAPPHSHTRHAQSRRFLDPSWKGLRTAEPPLRIFVERLASGDSVNALILELGVAGDLGAFRAFLHWLSGFRLVPRRICSTRFDTHDGKT